MLPTQSVVKALTVAGYPPNRAPHGLSSLPAMAAQYAKLQALQKDSQWPALARYLGPEVSAIHASLGQANGAMTRDARQATSLMNAAEQRLHAGTLLSRGQIDGLRATAAQLQGLQTTIQNTYAALHTAGLYEADRHPVATQIATWRASLASRLDAVTQRPAAGSSPVPAAVMAASASTHLRPGVDRPTAAVDAAVQAIGRWGELAQRLVNLPANAAPEEHEKLAALVMRAGQQLQQALVDPAVVQVMKAGSPGGNLTAAAIPGGDAAASPSPNGWRPGDGGDKDPKGGNDLNGGNGLRQRLLEAVINAAASGVGDQLEHVTGGAQLTPEKLAKGTLIAASIGFLMPAGLRGPVKGSLINGAASGLETYARQKWGIDPENPLAVVASFFFAAGLTEGLHRLHRLNRATPSSGAKEATSVWQQELYKKLADAMDDGGKNLETVLLRAKHPNGKPQLTFFNEGNFAKTYTELGPKGKPTGRLLRLPDASSSENEANRAFVAASKLRLGPEIFEITPNLTVMAKVPGHSGSYMLPSSITESKSERVVAAFVERLARFHRAGWIHGDVHFDNVVFDPKAGTLKLIDFDNSRTQRDLLTSKETQRLFRVDVDRAYRDVVALLKPDGVTELAWFQDFKRVYLQALAGGADEASHKSTVHKARFDLAASKLRDLEASIESGPFLLPKLVRLRGDK